MKKDFRGPTWAQLSIYAQVDRDYWGKSQEEREDSQGRFTSPGKDVPHSKGQRRASSPLRKKGNLQNGRRLLSISFRSINTNFSQKEFISEFSGGENYLSPVS